MLLIFVGLLLVLITTVAVFIGIYLANKAERVKLYDGTYTVFGKPEKVEGDTMWVFRNIPYGKAERFQYPGICGQDANCYSQQYKDTIKCMQLSYKTSSLEGIEDCLVLTIITPNISANLPTVVWVHGGALMTGDSQMYGPRSDFAHDIGSVVVSINYRVNLLGFLSVEELLDESLQTYGNYGHGDQIAALAWLNENIKSFGGDPNRVTLIGESAGGTSLLALLTSPLANNLFHNIIPLSPALHWRVTKEEASELYRVLLSKIKCSGFLNTADCLKSINATYIIGNDTGRGVNYFDFPDHRNINANDLFLSVVDGKVIEKPPVQYSSLSFKPKHKIGIFLGNTGQESGFINTTNISSYSELNETLSSKLDIFNANVNFSNQTQSTDDSVMKIVTKYKIDRGKTPGYYSKMYHTIMSDVRSTCPSNYLATTLSQNDVLNVYRIYFNYRNDSLSFTHGDDIAQGFGLKPSKGKVMQLFREMVRLIAHDISSSWQPYPDRTLYMSESDLVLEDGIPQEEICTFWKSFKMDYQYGWEN